MKNDFPWTKAAFDKLTSQAVASYWGVTGKQKATESGKDTGTRGGKHMNGFIEILVQVAVKAGYTESEIRHGSKVTLPGYYRSQKEWDFAIIRNGKLLAAIELKSQGSDYGKNQNNRIEEVLGLARDFWVAHDERPFSVTPWLGYAFLLVDSPASRQIRKTKKSDFPVFPAFEEASYADRYRIACERLMIKKDYDATALISTEAAHPTTFAESSPELSFYKFCRSLYFRLRAEA